MTSNDDRWACDTSVAVAALDSTHVAHETCRQALVQHRPALAGHAAFETYSVLTRLPLPLRLDGTAAASVLAQAFPAGCWLDARAAGDLLARLARLNIVGGSVYDALVGLAASTNQRVLLTRDRRAERTYRALEVRYQFVG
ncbi:type II toxin-antitoxin system VapC family toxin [Mycolicibacter sp. MYC123]|uniref:Ribonuclease VapC n=1 Tax=[Mycobacterium] zoologicum TaxID=2872311 RepID=A0ABU5YIL4_9MYCO|nr:MULTISPECIES: type II toxin-antitoxin system VapC family toxin [unclassified Mycolicibacter]MEB3049895.1 type II toxin-antitoxin system VapC family toxin [Mycolicibacter sp. MYC123]MEB3063243.1 type II toxin-antitoxin system VapC family toxin [Mycolicibacter sp. MYC101]